MRVSAFVGVWCVCGMCGVCVRIPYRPLCVCVRAYVCVCSSCGHIRARVVSV